LKDAAAIVGIAETPFARTLEASEKSLAVQAILAALDDAGIEPAEVDGFASYTLESTDEVEIAKNLGARVVVPALVALGVRRLDLVVVSHADLDHRGGVPAVLRALPVGEVWVPYGVSGEPPYRSILAAAREAGVPVRERGAGSHAAAFGALRVTPLWPPSLAVTAASRNDRSLVVRAEVGGRRLLLPGDLEVSGEEALLASGADLRADVLKLCHHGSRTSSSEDFLAAVGAAVALASAPCHGRFGMPHPEVVRRLRQRSLALWWTGRDGAVMLQLGEPLAVWPWAAGPLRQPSACGKRPAARGARPGGLTSAAAPRPRRR